jgi:hypothetical protein
MGAPSELDRCFGWLVRDWNWPAASLFTGGFLLLIAPAWFGVAGLPLTLVYLQLPIYQLHQWEEHAGDRFRQYINRTLAGGREALTPMATFWINSLGVWGIDLATLYLATIDLSLGLIAIYLPLVNAVAHIGPSVKRREYNPGLWTSLALFIPIGGFSLYVVAAASGATWIDHAIGIGVAIAVHAAIAIHVARRIARLSRADQQ